MTIEFLHEHHADKEHSAMTRLFGDYSSTIREKYAQLDADGATLHVLTSHTQHPPTHFHITAAEADAFVEAWLAFKANTAEWLQIEAEKKARAEKAEQDRQLAVWKEVERLASSIPGLEILAREETVWDEDDENGTTTAWEVMHRALGRGNKYLYHADQVLLEVQGTIEEYHQHLQHLENVEKADWNGWYSAYVEEAKNFLATHRAFVASKTPSLVEQPA